MQYKVGLRLIYLEKNWKLDIITVNRKHLVIQKTDKGSAVVILEKNVYTNKMKKTISDNKFEQINIEEDKQLNFLLKGK